MSDLGKWLIFIGIVFVVLGALLYVASRIPGLGRLPGDIVMKGKNYTFYFPLATCVLISLFISFILFLINRR